MALKVWLPLNNSLENKGTGNVILTSGTPAFKAGGKIGANALNLKTQIQCNCPQLSNLETFSICFWAITDPSDTITTNWVDLIGFTDVSSGGSNGTFRWETSYGGSGSKGIHWHDNATYALSTSAVEHTNVQGTWCHCCVIFNKDTNLIYTYANGTLINSVTHQGGHFNTSGAWYMGHTNAIEGRMNDLRIYDHALSPAEVKEISQGLVLHYKLDDITNGIQDSSGYGHTGEIIGMPTITSDSPRYSSCLHIGATGQHIKCGIIATSGFSNTYSFSWWGKASTFSNTMQWGFSDGIRLNGVYYGTLWNTGDSSNNPLYSPGTTTQVTAPTTGEWHHFVMTGDGTTCKVYKDGVHWGTAKTYKAISGTQIYINGWANSTSYSNSDLSISDFRVYCTALSADDILALYHISAKIDNLGNIHTFELNENNTNKLTKTGILYDNMIEPFITLSDGSKWQLLLYHYVDGGRNLFTQSNATFCNNFGLYSRLQFIDNFTYDNKYEFYVIQDGKEFRWTQTNQPTAASIAGLTTVSGYNNPVNGLAKSTSLTQTYIGYNSWWGACGCWTSFSTGGNTGIPGFGTHDGNGICTKYLALYARISEPKAHIANLTVYANNLIER